MKKLGILFFALLLCSGALAQGNSGVEMSDPLRNSGKIYVVVVTIAIIFIGLAIYLFSIDRRLRKIEKDN
ncbi:MAG: CcmD family protein [Sphingobacteriaceae bacterium]